MPNASNTAVYVFDEYRLEVAHRMLYRGAEELALPPKAIETLIAFLERRGEIISKEDLLKIIWADAVVEESNLFHYTHILRRALGDKPDGTPYIETLRRRGFRFTSEVSIVERAPEAPKNKPTELLFTKKTDFPKTARESADADVCRQTPNASPPKTRSPGNYRQWLAVAAAFVVTFGAATFAYFQIQTFKPGSRSSVRGEISVTPLTSGQMLWNATISPDGTYFVYQESDGTNTRLWLQQTGQTARIELIPPGARGIGGKTFSPNGEFVYFVGQEKGERQFSLYRVPTLGGAAVKILNPVASPPAFSPDGGEMVFVRHNEKVPEMHLVIAAADGSSERVLLTSRDGEEFSNSSAAWSPDGKTVAFVSIDRRSASGEGAYTILGIDITNGAVRKLSPENWENCFRMAWTPDGAGLIFIGTRSGEAYTTRRDTIYYLSVADGQARRVTTDGNRYDQLSLGVTNDNAIFAVPSKNLSQIWMMDAAGESQNAIQLTNGQADGRAGIATLPDGRVGYISRFGENLSIWIMNGDGSEQRLIASYFPFVEELRATPDGRYFIFSARRDHFSHLYRIDVDGTNLKQLTDGESYEISSGISPDSRWIYYGAKFFDGTHWVTELRRTAVENLETTVLRRFAGDELVPSVSPDGRSICILNENGMKFYSAFDGTELGSIKTDEPAEVWTGAKWTPDGNALTYLVYRRGSVNIRRHPLGGSANRQLTNFSKGYVSRYAFSNDGARIYFARGYQVFDAVLIKNWR